VAIANLRRICDEHLDGKYRIQIIDLLVNPQLSRDDQIVAIPTLMPIRRIIGDLSDTARTLVGLQLPDPDKSPAPRKLPSVRTKRRSSSGKL
jgi:circadian clock protein KaiB